MKRQIALIDSTTHISHALTDYAIQVIDNLADFDFHGQFDLIIIGPAQDPEQVAAIRARTPEPILMVLPDESDASLDAFDRSQATDYIVAPVKPRPLQHRVRHLLRTNDLNARQARNRHIVRMSSDFIYTVKIDDDGAAITDWVSDTMESIHGYPKTELNQPNIWQKLIHPADQAIADERLQDLMNGQARTDIFRIISRSGETRWIEEHAQPVWNEAKDRVAMIYGAGRDITHIRETEAALVESQETLKLALEANEIDTWDWDIQADCVRYSPGGLERHGYTLAEIGQPTLNTWLSRVHPEDLARVRARIDAHLAGETPRYEAEHRVLAKDGQYQWAHAHGLVVERTEDGTPLRMVGVQRNISDTKELAEALRKNEERHRIISEMISDFAYSYIVQEDGSLKKDWSTQAFHDITGYSFHEVDQDGWRMLIHPDDRQKATHRSMRLMAGEFDVTEFRIISKHGDVRWLRDHGQPVWDDEQGRVVHIYGAAQDITERKRFEEQLQRQTEELRARNEELDAFAYTVAHDLKNPISSMMGFASLIQTYYSRMDDEKIQEYLELIMESGYKLKEIINALLMLAGVNKMETAEVSDLDMQMIVDSAKQRLVTIIQQKEATITMPDDWPSAAGYAPWVEEVWTNYISNALKYGGHPPKIELGARQDNGITHFYVKDNGDGLSQEEQARVFTPFTRFNQVKIEGHGLGLSIVQRIVHRLGGEVTIESEPGKGSIFGFTLPTHTPST